MTLYEFMEKMLAAFPTATVGEDNDGQLIIYTGLANPEGETIVALDPVDEDNFPTETITLAPGQPPYDEAKRMMGWG